MRFEHGGAIDLLKKSNDPDLHGRRQGSWRAPYQNEGEQWKWFGVCFDMV